MDGGVEAREKTEGERESAVQRQDKNAIAVTFLPFFVLGAQLQKSESVLEGVKLESESV